MVDPQSNDRNADDSDGTGSTETPADPMTVPSVEQPADPKPDHDKKQSIRLDPIGDDEGDAGDRSAGDDPHK
ncbi:hypothetical protein [Leifsonia sp. A12D58]|uniref:hypothetical protein n=1 Tax=Leifsonia sp. A12D58 TaxID=3397674 RepID=UPI0039E18D4D